MRFSVLGFKSDDKDRTSSSCGYIPFSHVPQDRCTYSENFGLYDFKSIQHKYWIIGCVNLISWLHLSLIQIKYSISVWCFTFPKYMYMYLRRFSFFPFFLSNYTGSLIHEHYTRDCEFGNFDKIKNKNNTKNKTTQKNTKTFG